MTRWPDAPLSERHQRVAATVGSRDISIPIAGQSPRRSSTSAAIVASVPGAGGALQFRSLVGPQPISDSGPNLPRLALTASVERRSPGDPLAVFFPNSVKFSDQFSCNIADARPGVSHD